MTCFIRSFLAVSAGIIAIAACIPYINDILHKRAVPSRSTRIMFVVLIILALFQQHDLGSRWSLFLLGGEFFLAVTVFIVSLKYGVGGFSRIDIVCYILLAIDGVFWMSTNNSLVGIHLTILADFIACAPMIIKTYKEPKSETPLFYWMGALAASLAILSETDVTYLHIAFPIYLGLINVIVALLTYRKSDCPTA